MAYIAYVSILAALLFGVLLARPDCFEDKGDFLEGKCAIEIDGRPDIYMYDSLPEYNKNLEPKKGGEKAIKLTRHHIIPFEILRPFFNNLVKYGKADQLTNFFTKFKSQFSSYFDERSKQKCASKPSSAREKCLAGFQTQIANLKKFVTGLYRKKMTFEEDQGVPEGFDDFQEFYVWMPGNLLIGPSARLDDPSTDKNGAFRKGFERKAGVIVGDKIPFTKFENAYDAMEKFIRTNVTNFNELQENLISIIDNTLQPYPLKKDNWIFDESANKYSIRSGNYLAASYGHEGISEIDELQTTTSAPVVEKEIPN